MRALWIPFSVALGGATPFLGKGGGRRFFYDNGFPDTGHPQSGPLLKGPSPVAAKVKKDVKAVYRPTDTAAGRDAKTWLLVGTLGSALLAARTYAKSKKKSETQSALVMEAWNYVAGILPSLEKAAEKTIQAQDFNRLAQLEAQVGQFEQVLDSLDVAALVQGGVFESEAAVREMRKGMLKRTEALLEKIERAFPEEEEQSAGPVEGAGAL
jgi:hypothetical protein